MKVSQASPSVVIKGVVFCIGFLVATFLYSSSIPRAFPQGTTFTVSENETVHSISKRLESEGYIRSAFLFRAWVSFLGEDKTLQLGLYSFPEALPLPSVVRKIVFKNPDAPLASVTVPEGSTSYEVAVLFEKALADFDIHIFGEKVYAQKADGMLFPSTYYLLPSMNEERVVALMTETFEKKYSEAFSDAPFPQPIKNRNELISLAAILEGEAKTKEDMHIVAGILLKRLQKGMRLQVDVAMQTYKNAGLPIQSINNPGLVAIEAALYPKETPYLYYLTGKDGIMHYSKTYEEHKRNIQKYLR